MIYIESCFLFGAFPVCGQNKSPPKNNNKKKKKKKKDQCKTHATQHETKVPFTERNISVRCAVQPVLPAFLNKRVKKCKSPTVASVRTGV